MSERVFAAIDLGASGGRVIAGVVDRRSVVLHEVHRFPNGVEFVDGHHRWDITRLFGEVLVGLARLAIEFPDVESIGIDTWAVDYALLDGDGRMIAEPIAYRDDRTDAVIDDVHALVSPEELYAVNGLQFLPFTTIYQLAAERRSGRLGEATWVVLLPDLIAFWLTGVLATEYTNASTTGLVDVTTRSWSTTLLERLGFNPPSFPALEQPGTVRGSLTPERSAALGLPSDVVVRTVGSHDTASAVAGVPATERFAYVASGTWSLVGVELDEPLLTDAARQAGFTNEAGVGGRTRLLRNVGGLWLLQESLRDWAERGEPESLPQLLDQAAALPGGPTFDVDDPVFITPGYMPRRITDAIVAAGGCAPDSRAALVRSIIDSLAVGYARAIDAACELTGRSVDTVHIVGGGSKNALLCRLTAAATGRRVVAGPAEATALGNITTQARAVGALPDDLDEVRVLLAASPDLVEYPAGKLVAR